MMRSRAISRRLFRNGPFIGCIESEGGFPPGQYAVTVYRVKEPEFRVEFSVAGAE